MERKTIENDEQFLRQKSIDVDFEKDDIQNWLIDIRRYCQTQRLFGVAPVQIGIPKRLIYFRNTTDDMNKNTDDNYDENIVVINPKIIRVEGLSYFLERCGSCLDKVGNVYRPYLVETEYYNLNREKKREIFKGIMATVFCHEYDHFEGILHIDKAEKVMEMSWAETREYRSRHPYEVISQNDVYFDNSLKLVRSINRK